MRLPACLKEGVQADFAERAAPRHDWIGPAGRPDRGVTHGAYRRTSDSRVNTTDPDARPMPRGEGRTRLGYQDHCVVDGGKARIILMSLVTPASSDALTVAYRPDRFGRQHRIAPSLPFCNSCSWPWGPRPAQENGRPCAAMALSHELARAIFRPDWVVCETAAPRQRRA